MGWWRNADLTVKYSAVLGSLVAAVVLTGFFKAFLDKRKLNKHIARLEEVKRLRDTVLDEERELPKEGELFGVRAIESGFYGGIVQSGWLTPVPSSYPSASRPTSLAGSFSTLIGSRSPSLAPNLPASTIHHSPASSTSLSVNNRILSTRQPVTQNRSENTQSPRSSIHGVLISPEGPPESTAPSLYLVEQNDALASQASALDSNSDQVLQLDLPLRRLGPAFSVSSSSDNGGNKGLNSSLKPLRPFPHPQSADCYRPSMLRNVDNVSIPDAIDSTSISDTSSFPTRNRAAKATRKLMKTLGLANRKDGESSDIKLKSSFLPQETTGYTNTSGSNGRSLAPLDLRGATLREVEDGEGLERTDNLGLYSHNTSYLSREGSRNSQLYDKPLDPSSRDTDQGLEDSQDDSDSSQNNTTTRSRSVPYGKSTIAYEPIPASNTSAFTGIKTNNTPPVDPAPKATQASKAPSLVIDVETTSAMSEDLVDQSRDSDLYYPYQEQSASNNGDSGPSPPQSSTSSGQPPPSSSSRTSGPLRSAITKIAGKPISKNSQASRSTSSLSSNLPKLDLGYGKARYVPQPHGFLSGMRADIVSIVHKGKKKSKS